ncbi:MAG: ATP-binding protein [Pseudomonadota bacterium]
MKTLLRLLKSTAFRLSLVYLLVFAVFAAALLGFVGWQSRLLFNDQLSATLNAEARGLADTFRLEGIRGLVDAVEARSRDPGGGVYLLTTFNGEPIAGNVAAIPTQSLESEGVYRLPYVGETSTDGGNRAVSSREAIAQVFHLPGGFRLVVGRDVEDQLDFQEVIRRASYFAAALVVLLGVFGGVYISRRVLRRVDAMSDTSQRIMAGNLAERLATDGSGDEFDRLARSVNAMLDRINELLHGLKEVSDNIAHDLRTPLTRLRSRAEDALRQTDDPEGHRAALEATVEEADSLMAVFTALLQIARAEAGSGDESFEPVDLGAVARDVADLYGPALEDASLSLAIDIADGCVVFGDKALLGQAIGNLLDNAITHAGNGEGDPSPLSLSVAREGGRVILSLADLGPGIPADQHDHVLERFVRLEASRSRPGSGLGLSLVAAISRLHKGTIVLRETERDRDPPGLTVMLSFPGMSSK